MNKYLEKIAMRRLTQHIVDKDYSGVKSISALAKFDGDTKIMRSRLDDPTSRHGATLDRLKKNRESLKQKLVTPKAYTSGPYRRGVVEYAKDEATKIIGTGPGPKRTVDSVLSKIKLKL